MAIPQADDIVFDLMTALLAVNRWTLEQIWSINEALQGQGLHDIVTASTLDPEVITERLHAAGYRRGRVSEIAIRVQHVAKALAEGGLQKLADHETAGDTAAIREYLLTLKGVGPTVAENYLRMRAAAAGPD